MTSSSSRRFPVTVTQLPAARFKICRRTVACGPGTLSEALTEHYRQAHPEALASPPSKVRSPPYHLASTVTGGNCPEPGAPAARVWPSSGERPAHVAAVLSASPRQLTCLLSRTRTG